MKTVPVSSQAEGIKKAHELVLEFTDPETVVWLSGGRTPKSLYEQLTHTEQFTPAEAILVDERFGAPGHADANESMIAETGLIDSLNDKNILFHQILGSFNLPADTLAHNKRTTKLINESYKHVLIMSIDTDGHTAGIFPDIPETSDYVVGYHTDFSSLHERITLTLEALKQLAVKHTAMIVLDFGQAEAQGIQHTLNEKQTGTANEIYEQLDRKNVNLVLITDQDATTSKD